MRFLILCSVFLLISVTNARENAATTRASFAAAIDQVSPAVVNIFTAKRVRSRSTHPLLNDPFFAQFFGRTAPLRSRVERSLGSGVIVTEDGFAVTNNHVVEGAEDIQIVFADGHERQAKIVNTDPKLDLAILKIQTEGAEKFPFAHFADSDSLAVGDVALAIGNPFGMGQSVSMGIVSALDRGNANLTQYSNFIQTDAAINPGNSGGALVDSTGAVIGINTAIFTKTGTTAGIGFAVPANLVQAVMQSILTTGRVSRPWLGAVGQNVTAPLAHQLGLDSPQGVLLNEIVPNSPADIANLRVGDVILKLDGRPVKDTRSLNQRIVSTPAMLNERVPLTIWREGAQRTINIRFEAMPERRKSDQLQLKGHHPLAGATVEKLSPALNLELDLPIHTQGVAILETSSTQNLRGFGIDLRRGDILLEINGTTIKSIRNVQEALVSRRQGWRITYKRGNRTYKVIVG